MSPAFEDNAVGNAVVGRGSAVLVGRGYGDGYRPLGIGAEGDCYSRFFTLHDTVGVLCEVDRYRDIIVVGDVYQYIGDGNPVILRVGARGSVSDGAVLVVVAAVLGRRYRDGLGRVPVGCGEGQICGVRGDIGVGRDR